jgi:hypothetical protein
MRLGSLVLGVGIVSTSRHFPLTKSAVVPIGPTQVDPKNPDSQSGFASILTSDSSHIHRSGMAESSGPAYGLLRVFRPTYGLEGCLRCQRVAFRTK